MSTPEQRTAGSYSRQSADKTKSIDDQAGANRAAAQANGWELVAEYADGSSASRFARKVRGGWARVLDDVDAGAFDVLILWESSRGDRTPESWLALLAKCRDRGISVHVVTHQRTYDMTNPREWRTLAEDGVDNAYESEKTSLRVRRGQASAAAAGQPSQGRTPYGYRRTYDPRTGQLTGQEPDPDTAPIVREIIERAARGIPISAIVNDLNARKVPTLTARQWYRVRVRDLAMNVAYIGVRVYNGEQFPGSWPALVEPETFYTAQRVLSDPSRVTTKPGSQRHLLSYLATCAPCGAMLNAVRGRYRCCADGCVTIMQADTDAFVTDVILGRLSKPDAYATLRQEGAESDRAVIEARNEAAKLRAQLDEWRLSAARGETSPGSLAVVEADLTGRIRAAERRGDHAAIPPALRQILEPGADVRVRWDAAPLAARREVIRALAVVTVRPGKPGRRTFDPLRLGGSRWVGDALTWGDHWDALEDAP